MNRKKISSNSGSPDFSRIQLLICDFDGVMTDNTVMIDHQGNESVICNRSDGMGIELLRSAGIETIVITKERGTLATQRCKKLKIPCVPGVDQKISVLRKELDSRNLTVEQACYIGNDVNDVDCMKACAIGVAVSDSHSDALASADFVTKKSGGKGAVREVCDLIIKHS